MEEVFGVHGMVRKSQFDQIGQLIMSWMTGCVLRTPARRPTIDYFAAAGTIGAPGLGDQEGYPL
jgi:hypothetical protein